MRAAGNGHACGQCLRRSWLLAALSASLDYRCHDLARLFELLALSDEDLMRAVGGRRREELRGRYLQLDAKSVDATHRARAVCRHDPRYPAALKGTWAPPMLNVGGAVDRLAELTARPVVAIMGTRRATDYGIEMAKSVARGLAAAGVTVTGGLTDGIAMSAHAGALEARGGSVAVVPGGLDVGCPARRRSLCERVMRSGCAVSELPRDCAPRRWGQAASERIVAGLATLTVVVEANEDPGELGGARLAQALGRTVAAVPGRVTSPASRGAHALLMAGARLVRGPADVLELLFDGGNCGATPAPAPAPARAALEPRLRRIFERVGEGADTPEKLAGDAPHAADALLALSELELLGLLARGDGGRYVPRDALAPREIAGGGD
jgi:DNA processing protein